MYDVNFEESLNDAFDIVQNYLEECNEFVDGWYGQGYAEKHPEIVGHMVQACAVMVLGSTLSKTARDIQSLIKEAHHGTDFS